MSESMSLDSIVCGLQDNNFNNGGMSYVEVSGMQDAKTSEIPRFTWKEVPVDMDVETYSKRYHSVLLGISGVRSAYFHLMGDEACVRLLCDKDLDAEEIFESAKRNVEESSNQAADVPQVAC